MKNKESPCKLIARRLFIFAGVKEIKILASQILLYEKYRIISLNIN